MATPPNESLGREPLSSSLFESSSTAASREAETASLSRYILPKDLNAGIRQLDDQEMDRLVAAALEERTRQKKPPMPEQSQGNRLAEADATPLPQGKLNAVKAAFRAGVTPVQIAREFGIPLSDVRKASRL
jgi:hypothetical protein